MFFKRTNECLQTLWVALMQFINDKTSSRCNKLRISGRQTRHKTCLLIISVTHSHTILAQQGVGSSTFFFYKQKNAHTLHCLWTGFIKRLSRESNPAIGFQIKICALIAHVKPMKLISGANDLNFTLICCVSLSPLCVVLHVVLLADVIEKRSSAKKISCSATERPNARI